MKRLFTSLALCLLVSMSLTLAATTSIAAHAQTAYVPVSAPYAQEIVLAAIKAHSELQKLGLHAIPPEQKDYAIIANGIPSKIGKPSSDADLVVLHTSKPTVKRDEKGKFFDLCLPISDASGNALGITVMEIPYAHASSEEDALAKAAIVRDELQHKITNHDQLFESTDVALKSIDTISLGAQGKRFDHFGVDLKHHRLFLAAEDAHSVLLLDSVDSRLIGKIDGFGAPHAILYREDLNRIYVTDGAAGDGKTGAVKIFDGKSLQLAGSVPLAADTDSIGYDASRHLLYVDNGGKDAGGMKYSLVSVIDTTVNTKVTDIRIDSETLEAMALDIWRPRMYVNNRAQNQITVIDRWKNKVVASWPVTLGKDNVAMALDEVHQRLFVGCRGGQVVVFDTNTGKELQALTITKGVDDMEYDAVSKRLYAAGGGTVDVFAETDADHFRSLGSFPAGEGARNARLVPAINRYYVAVPQGQDGNASVHIFQPLNYALPKPTKPEESVEVNAPFALKLDLATMSAHPDLRKMGFHGVPPGGKDSVIIANANTVRIGFKSSAGDLDAVKDGKTYCIKRDDGSFYNAKLPLKDASGKTIGILVMEIPFTSVADEAGAVHMAEEIREELAPKIPSYGVLFQQ
jgi:hypothetical protein